MNVNIELPEVDEEIIEEILDAADFGDVEVIEEIIKEYAAEAVMLNLEKGMADRESLSRNGRLTPSGSRKQWIISDRPTDVEKDNDTVTLHFESSEAASRWSAKVSNEIVICENAEPANVPSDEDILRMFSELAHNDEDGARFIYVEEGQAIDIARALLSRHGHAATPEGWQLVPKVPTEEMLDVMHGSIRILVTPNEKTADIQNDVHVWSSMLKAAPTFGGNND